MNCESLVQRWRKLLSRITENWYRLIRLIRATNHLGWWQGGWKTDLARWLERSSPETYCRIVQDNVLDAHLERVLAIAKQRYAELRQRGVSWRQARRQVEQEIAGQIGKVHIAMAPTTTLPTVGQVPVRLDDWLPKLDDAVRQGAPEGYAEAKRRGILRPHLENVLHWARDQWRTWPEAERSNPTKLRELFEQARQRAVMVDWQKAWLGHDPQRWPEDIVRYWRWLSPERAAHLEKTGSLGARSEKVVAHLRCAWQQVTHDEVPLSQWLAFTEAALCWSVHPWHELLEADRFTSLTVDIVGSCNARCPFCPRVAMPADRAKGFMDFELFRRILQRGKEHGIHTLYLYSTGEPTLHPRFDDFVAVAKDLDYFVVCSTNGSMMHQHRKGLSLADVVQVSIEGWDRVSYERYRYPLRFDKVYQNVQEYASIRPARQRYVVNCLLTRKTDVEQYALLWGQFFDEVVFHPMYPTAGVLDGRHRAIPEPSLADDYWWFEPAVLPTCSDLFQKLTIAFDGKRVLCCQDFSASLPLGHAEDDWKTLYHHPLLERVREELRSQTFATCQNCGNLVELPENIRAALVEEIHRVWQTHPIRARPNTASLETGSLDYEVANWLRRIALQALRQTPTTSCSQANSRGSLVADPSPETSRGVSLHVISSTDCRDEPASHDDLPTTCATPPTSPAGPNEKHSILLLVTEVAEFTALLRLAERLRQLGSWQPIIYFTEPYPLLPRDVLRCRQRRLPVWAGPRVLKALRRPALFDNSDNTNIEPTPLDAPQRALLEWCHALNLPELEAHLTMLRCEWAFFCKALERIEPRCLVLGQENVSKYTSIYSHIAQQAGVGCVIVPWCLASREEFEEALSAIPLYDATTPSARAFCERFPQWRLAGKKELLRAPVYEAAALEILRCAPENPWAFYSGFASAIAVESPWMMHHYQRQGVPPSWLRLTGSWCDDDLQEGLRCWQDKRRQLCKELHLDPDRPLLLVALPSNQMRHRGSYAEFTSYEEILQFWADSFAALRSCQTVLVTHPSVSPAYCRQLERDNVRLSDRPTYELVPLADALVACVSSIIRWALACGLPVLDYDLYRFRYSYFRQEPQVRTVETRHDFTNALKELAADLRPGQHVPQDGLRISPWGLLDGQSTSRIHQLLMEVAALASSSQWQQQQSRVA